MEQVADFLQRAVDLALKVQAKAGKKLKDFEPALMLEPELMELKLEVEAFAGVFPMPGVTLA